MTTVEDEATAAPAKMTLPTLTAMVVGSMVGAGVFFLPVAGTGMLMLAFVFQTLAIRKPELDSGIFAYAKAGFGDYIGFNSAFGYWASACVGSHQRWRGCLGAGRLPGLDPDGGRSALHPRHLRRHAAVPQAREQSGGTDHGLDLVQLIRPAHSSSS
jgi:hypothetical protein